MFMLAQMFDEFGKFVSSMAIEDGRPRRRPDQRVSNPYGWSLNALARLSIGRSRIAADPLAVLRGVLVDQVAVWRLPPKAISGHLGWLVRHGRRHGIPALTATGRARCRVVVGVRALIHVTLLPAFVAVWLATTGHWLGGVRARGSVETADNTSLDRA
jgi:hypothetical protein